MAVDASGNVTVVSGPGFYTALVVTSYTSTGALRWRRTVSPFSGTMAARWVVAAPNGDVVALGSTSNTQATYAITLVRFDSNGTLLWRIDPPVTIFRSSVGRLVIDAAGSTFVTFNNQVAKYSASGVLLWTQTIPAGFTTSMALGPDGSDVVVTGNFWGSFNSVIGSFDAATGAQRWMATAAEGSNDVVVGDDGCVYVTGQSYTGEGTPALAYFLTVIAYDRTTGARLWRTDSSPGSLTAAVGLRIALAPDGSVVATGYASGGYIDWWTVAIEADGAIRWQARRDRAPYPDEIPSVVFVLADGTTVVSGLGGPLVGPTPTGMSYPQGVTAGYGPDGTLLWEGFSKLPTAWAAALPSGDVCATGGYDALVTCWQISNIAHAVISATPSTGVVPLSVTFDGSASTAPQGTVNSWTWSFGDGASGTGSLITHVYNTAGTYTATLRVGDSTGALGEAAISIVVNPLPPTAPSNLTATPTGTFGTWILLAWQDNSTNETGFDIERCQGSGCANFAFWGRAGTSSTSSSDSVNAGTTYRYRIRAFNSGGYSAYSNIATVVTPGSNQPPTAVMSAAPTTGVGPLSVTFNGSGSTDPDGTIASWAWSFGDGASGSGTTITHVYTAAGTYVPTLTVTDNGGATSTTSTSIVVNAPALPSPPANLTATALSRSSIGLAWTNTTTNQTEVRIERCLGSSCTNFTQVAVVAGTAKAFTDGGLASRTTYRYRVRAHNAIGDSPYSNRASAQTKR
jgi:PKD repeat protein